MKKNIIKSNVIAAVAIFAGYNVYQSNVNAREMSDIMLANVEALAQSESGGIGITCSAKCNDGIGRCWLKSNGNYCMFSGSELDSCTGYGCRLSDGTIYY